MKHSKYLANTQSVDLNQKGVRLPFAVIGIRVKFKTSVWAKVGRRRRDSWPWFLGREDGAVALFRGSRMRTKGYVALKSDFLLNEIFKKAGLSCTGKKFCSGW